MTLCGFLTRIATKKNNANKIRIQQIQLFLYFHYLSYIYSHVKKRVHHLCYQRFYISGLYANTQPGRNKTRKMQGKMNVELLFSLVLEHKELYDKRDRDYNHLDKRELLWGCIAEQIGTI